MDTPRDLRLPAGAWVELAGEGFDLEEVTKLFSQATGVQVRREGNSYFLGDASLSALPDDVARRDRAVEIVELINGAAQLHWTNHRRLTVGSRVVTIAPDGSRSESIVLAIEAAESRSRAQPVTVLLGGVPVPAPPPAPPRWVDAALQDDDVAAALRILSDSDVSWARLYHVFEIVEADVGSGILRWATRSECGRFTQTANSRPALGDEARHGDRSVPAPKAPMKLPEARALVRRIVAAWLEERVP